MFTADSEAKPCFRRSRPCDSDGDGFLKSLSVMLKTPLDRRWCIRLLSVEVRCFGGWMVFGFEVVCLCKELGIGWMWEG